jgi:hypothetical protein
MNVTFQNAARSSTWILTEKLQEVHDQLDTFDFETSGGNSAAYGTFLCKNINNLTETAIMRVFMQPLIMFYSVC